MQMNYNPYQQQQQPMNYNPVFANYPQMAQNISQRIQQEPQIMGKIVQNAIRHDKRRIDKKEVLSDGWLIFIKSS